jgi:uncharacterized membrane-anchored protein
MSLSKTGYTIAAAFVLAAVPISVFAQDSDAPTESQKAWEAAFKVAKMGPADVILADQAVLHVPAEMTFIPKDESNALLVAWGNTNDDRLLGMVVPKSNDENWVVTVDQSLDGYVKDDEAKKWNADELLQSLKDGTEASNKDRMERGFPALDVVGWIEKPSYDSVYHRLIWSMKMVHRGAAAGDEAVVNYNTYALGRDGYLEVDLLTNETGVEKEKPYARQVLSALEFNKGKRYEDFQESTDHIAEYGIAALIGGVAAKKLGLLAVASVFVLKFIKIIAVGAVVAGGAVMRFFRGTKKDSA